jgi:Na+/H+-dicarboxylate symporter
MEIKKSKKEEFEKKVISPMSKHIIKPLNISNQLMNSKVLYSKIHFLVKSKLWLQVLIAMFLGIFVGFLIDSKFGGSETAVLIGNWFSVPGILFMNLIQIVIIPLIFVSIILGINSAGSLKQLKKIGLMFVAYLLITTSIAVIIAIILASFIQPGNYISRNSFELNSGDIDLDVETFSIPGWNEIPEFIDSLLPTNIFSSMVSGELLSMVFFAILFGIALMTLKIKNSLPLISVLNSIQSSCMVIIKWAMLIVPLAVFGMMIKVTLDFGISTLIALSYYVLTVLLGLFIMMILYLFIAFVFGRLSPIDYITKIKDAQLLAFSTSSSAAVMPLSMKISEEELKVRKSVSKFVIPIGAVANMNGTAIYMVVAVIFLAQLFNVPLGITSLLILSLSVIGASIGTPSVPGAGIAILATILIGLGIPSIGIALILGVDRILDMSRTTINVTGDLTASLFIDRVISER